MATTLVLADYQALAEFRFQLRKFFHFSEQAARAANLEPRQYQLLLAIKGLPKNRRPRIRDLAELLMVEHHSMVELVDRLASSGHVRRVRGDEDRREVMVLLTQKGERVLRSLALSHHTELSLRGPALITALKRVMRSNRQSTQANWSRFTDYVQPVR
jgi:DNA-binding MarR family transcriptional regulator